MKRYVLCFPLPLRRDPAQHVLLLEREKDDWQKGKLNLLGGGIHDGESVEAAAARELHEEGGLLCSSADVKEVGQIRGKGWIVHVVRCPYRDGQTPKTRCDEGVIHHVPWSQIKDDPRLHANLRLIVPLCQSNVANWILDKPVENHGEEIWIVNLGPAA